MGQQPKENALAVSLNSVAVLVRCLILLGAVAQLWLVFELRYDLPVFLGGGIDDSLAEIGIYLSPILLALGATVLARWLHRRGSGWALPAAGVPCAILLLGLGLAVYLTFNPISFHQP